MAVLTAHEHGKSRVRLGRTWRDASTRAHYFVEWEVAVRLISPAMDKAYTDGDNSGMTTTDTTRNMVRCVAFAYCVLQVFLSFVCVCARVLERAQERKRCRSCGPYELTRTLYLSRKITVLRGRAAV